ncbi:MAG: PD-(D/E)XK nuclease family protein [Phycisphaeraceae bacterium]
MACERVFLDWDQPALYRAVEVLRERFEGSSAGLGDVLVATPSQAAGRRLIELLTTTAQGGVEPPDVVPLGRLPERLYRPEQPVVDPLRGTLLRMWTLRRSEVAVRELTPHPPADDDELGWYRLAQQLESLANELAASGRSVRESYQRLEDRNLLAEGAAVRWRALAELDDAYHAALRDRGLVDLQEARRRAIANAACTIDRPLVLLGLDDLPPLIATMIGQLEGPVLSLIHAPPEEAAGFNEYGVLRSEAWRDRDPKMSHEQLRFVDSPDEQARAVAGAIADAARAAQHDTRQASDDPGKDKLITASHVTVGVADPALAGHVRRTLDTVGVATREPMGRPMSMSPPVAFLRAVADYASSRRLDALAALARHPDAESLLTQHSASNAANAATTHSVLSNLDRHLTKHLQVEPGETLLGRPELRDRVEAARRAIDTRLPDAASRPRPLPHWTGTIRGLLGDAYGDRPFTPNRPADDATALPLEAIAATLDEYDRLEPDDESTPRVVFAEALRLTAERLSGQGVPEPGGVNAVELLGLLELPLDDAPVMIVVGANEGRWPTPPASFPLLPESLRPPLGLIDREQRLARDRYRLIAMSRCRSMLRVIAGRWSPRGDPLAPSRVLISSDDEQAADVMRRFFLPAAASEADATHDYAEAGTALPLVRRGVSRDGFLLPFPMDVQPVTRMAVTAFRDYLACPYRFFLRRVMKLEPLDDTAVELTPSSFGTLAHDVLQALAEDPDAAHSTDPARVRQKLLDSLSREITRRMGTKLRPAVRLQRIALEERLEAFAVHQAYRTREGWLIDTQRVERDFHATVRVDASPFTITGRIDRVDRHAETGEVCVLDYKTSDTARKPRQAHQRKGQWVDLQLPIYASLAEPLNLGSRVKTGFMNLPRKPDEVGLAPADWSDDELAEAIEARDEVIRAVRDELRFWPPADAPAWPDEFSGLCADASMDRRRLIERSRKERER